MNNNVISNRKASEIKHLADRIDKIKNMKKFSNYQHDEATTLAHAIGDIEKSCTILLHKSIPKLFNTELSTQEQYDTLLDIGEELRHIMYHIEDSRFYNYLIEK